ncbi:MAG: TIGR02099 family protein [Oleiphilaceae bacterium]|nr:TIGR02099 family protein [Oleiphilaceae bacterium]
MNRTYKLLKFKAKLLAYAALIAVLVYVVAGRLVLSQLPDYRLSLQSYLSSELELPVVIDQLGAKWSGFDPILEIRGISVNGAPNAHIKTAQIKFAFLDTLLNQAPRIKSIKLDQTNLALHQDSQGGWSLAGVDLFNLQIDDDSTSQFAIEDILDGANLKLVDAYVRVTVHGKEERVWHLPSSSLTYIDGQIFAQGNVIRPNGLQPLARFVYNSADFESSSSTAGKLYIEARSADFLDRFLEAYSWKGLVINDLDVSGRVWLDLAGLNVEGLYADVQLHRLNWSADQKTLLPIVNSSARFSWQGNENGHRVALDNLVYQWNGQRCSIPGAVLESSEAGLDVSVSQIDLDCTGELLRSVDLLDSDLSERLRVSDPSGLLKNMHIALDSESDDFSFKSELHKVSLKPFRGTPGATNIDGFIEVNENLGYVDFYSEKFGLFFPDLYLKSFDSYSASGRVQWYEDGDDYVVESQGLSLKLFDDAEVTGDFVLRLNDDSQEDYLGLMLGMTNVELSNVIDFVPYYAVDSTLHQWLAESLKSGIVEDGRFIGYGSIESDSPNNSFSSTLALRAKPAELKFDELWPSLTDLDLTLNLHNDRLIVEAESAQINGVSVRNLSAVMPGVSEEEPDSRLQVDAELSLDGADYDYWLSESPIADATRGVSDLLSFEGPAEANLGLNLVFQDELQTDYSIDVYAQGLKASHRDSHLFAENIMGKLEVDSQAGINADMLSMQFMGEAAFLNIENRLDIAATELKLSGQLNPSKLFTDENKRSSNVPFYGVSGRTAFESSLIIPDAQEPARFEMTSNMQGLAVTWPEPFAKISESKNSVQVNASIKEKQADVSIILDGQALPKGSGQLLFIDEQLEYGKLVLSSSLNPLDFGAYRFTEEGLGVAVALDHIEVEPWIDFASETFTGEAGEAGILKEIFVKSPVVDMFNHRALDVEARISPSLSKTNIVLSGEGAEGEIVFAKGAAPVSVNLKHLRIEEPAESLDGDSVADVDPREIEAMSFAVDDLYFGGTAWGAWRFWTDSDDYGMVFRELRGEVSGSVLEGQLSWQYDEGHSHTILTLDVAGANVKPVLELFGQESPLTSGKYKSELALVWPDQPQNFALSKVSGTASMTFEDGVISTDNQATGILRLFGVFNVDALVRRLKLDFSDLYKQGISYDSLNVNVVMDQGDLRFVDPLKINGPSSNYTLSGHVDLAEQMLDLKMLVELPLSSNVPIAGLMLGNPAIGGAVWLVDKILGQPLSRLSTVRYAVKGNWDNPDMTLEQAINAK